MASLMAVNVIGIACGHRQTFDTNEMKKVETSEKVKQSRTIIERIIDGDDHSSLIEVMFNQ